MNYYTLVAKIAFLVLLFFSLFGTSIPFQVRDTTNPVLEEIATSNTLNQVIFILLFFLSLFSLISKSAQILQLIKKEKFLFLFLLWCLFSIIWSNDNFVSFKRLFQIITGILVIVSFLLHTKTERERISPIQFILFLYLVLSIIACIAISGAKDPAFNTWRGFAATKNQLGQISVICFLLSAIAYKYNKSKGYIQIAMMFLSFVLLIGSQSGTSIISWFIIMIIYIFILGDKIYNKLRIGHVVTISFLITMLLLITTVFIFGSDLLESLPYLIGKDLTFTGRTELWQDLIYIAGKNFIWGVGYQSFWTTTNPDAITIYDLYIWIPNQAHNGYLDLLISIGAVGLLLFFLIIIKYFIINFRFHIENPWKWIFFAVLIINLQESTLFRPGNFTGIMFIFSYLTAMSNYYFTETMSIY
jgi:O-antigen ligase